MSLVAELMLLVLLVNDTSHPICGDTSVSGVPMLSWVDDGDEFTKVDVDESLPWRTG